MDTRLRRTIAMLSIVAFLPSPPAKPTPPPNPGGLTQDKVAHAIPLADPNDRTIPVGPGGSIVYFLEGLEDVYLEVIHEVEPNRRRPCGLAAPLSGPATYTQTCGVNVYAAGMLMARLRNRANVTYFLGITTSPARFNWMDMYGTKTFSILASWRDLGQRSSPALGVRFEKSGYTQAWGNLYRSISGVGRTDYFVSYLDVKTSGTSCR